MMTKNEALHVLNCFFRGDSPFEQTKELVGHASSGIPDLFEAWYARQTDEDRRVIAEVLIEAVIEGGEFDKILPQACFIMVEMAMRHPSSIPKAIVAKVERLLNRGDAVRTWINDEESDIDHRKDFRARWRFALTLWNVLWAVGSPVARDVFEVFAKDAKDPHFARSIKLARSIARPT